MSFKVENFLLCLKVILSVTMETIYLVYELSSLCVMAACRRVLPNKTFGSSQEVIQGNVCLITGAGRGLGREIVLQLVRLQPRKIILWDLIEDDLDETKKVISNCRSFNSTSTEISCEICDITDHNKVERKIKMLRNTGDSIDLLINNAGILLQNGLFYKSNMNHVKKVFDVNVLAQINLIHQVLPDMLTKGKGHIVQISSISSRIAVPFASAYSTSKFAITGFMECLAFELLGTGVHSSTMILYKMNTTMFEGFKTRVDWLIPELSVEYVARETIQAILTKTQTVTLSCLFYPVVLLKSILPDSSWHPIVKFINLHSAMRKCKTS